MSPYQAAGTEYDHCDSGYNSRYNSHWCSHQEYCLAFSCIGNVCKAARVTYSLMCYQDTGTLEVSPVVLADVVCNEVLLSVSAVGVPYTKKENVLTVTLEYGVGYV